MTIKGLTDNCINYFSDRREYNESIGTFEEIKGKDFMLKYAITSQNSKIFEKDPADPIIDLDDESKELSEKHLKTAMSIMYKAPVDEIQIMSRSLMVNGKTEPIKIDACLYDRVPKTCYAKKADWRRVFGTELYNILTLNQPLDFVFNEDVFIQASAPGRLKHYIDNDDLENNPVYLENLVRADTLAEFLAIHDLIHGFNTRIDEDYNIHFFDFDEAFTQRTYNLWDNNEMSHDLPIVEIIEDESRRITRFAQKERARIESLVDCLNELGTAGDYLMSFLGQYGF